MCEGCDCFAISSSEMKCTDVIPAVCWRRWTAAWLLHVLHLTYLLHVLSVKVHSRLWTTVVWPKRKKNPKYGAFFWSFHPHFTAFISGCLFSCHGHDSPDITWLCMTGRFEPLVVSNVRMTMRCGWKLWKKLIL